MALPTYLESTRTDQQHQATLAQLAAQTQGQNISNQQAQAELNEYNAMAPLRDAQRETQMHLQEIYNSPDYRDLREQFAMADIRGQVDTAEMQIFDNALNLMRPAITEFKTGDAGKAMQFLEEASNSPMFERYLSDPTFNSFIQGLFDDDPNVRAQTIGMFDLYDAAAQEKGRMATQQKREDELFTHGLNVSAEDRKQQQMTNRALLQGKQQGEYGLAKQGMVNDASASQAASAGDGLTAEDRLDVAKKTDEAASRIMQASFPEEFAAYTGEGGSLWDSLPWTDGAVNPERYEEVRGHAKRLASAVASGAMSEADAADLLRRGFAADMEVIKKDERKAQQDDWLERAQKANKGMSRDQLIREGIAAGKLDRDYD